MAWELALKLAIAFRHLVKGNSFPASWRVASIAPVLKESSSSDVRVYGTISVTFLLSIVFEKTVGGKLSHFFFFGK